MGFTTEARGGKEHCKVQNAKCKVQNGEKKDFDDQTQKSFGYTAEHGGGKSIAKCKMKGEKRKRAGDWGHPSIPSDQESVDNRPAFEEVKNFTRSDTDDIG